MINDVRSSAVSQERPSRPSVHGRPGLVAPALVVVATIWTLALLVFGLSEGLLAWDVRFAYLPAAEQVLDGDSPYPALDDPILEEQKGYVYPPQLVLLLVPLTALPIDVVALLVGLGLLALVVATLYVLGVRDVAVYAASFLWMPTASGVLLANVSIPLAFATALLWVYRDRLWPGAAALGLAVSAKLVLWPLLVWTAVTGRVRLTVRALAVAAALTLSAWAVIGFAGLSGYPDLLRRLDEIQAANSYSFVGMAATLGLGETFGRAVALLVGGALLASCVVLARRGEEFRAFTCAVAATLALSPIVWLHYLLVLIVPLAIARPRFSPIWLLPVLLWISPRPGYAEGFKTFLPAIAAAILVGFVLMRGRAPSGVSTPIAT
jgi:alpha-1,2-mannosyltransferase